MKIEKYFMRLTRYSFTSLLPWLAVGYLIRMFFMPLMSSPDHVVLLWESSVFLKTGLLIPSGDPPPVFFITASFLSLSSFIFPSSRNIINSFIPQSYSPFVSSMPFFLSQPSINILLFVSKIPYLIFDIATAFLLLHIITDCKKALYSFKLWMLNPIAIFVSFIVGQYDIIPTFFLLLALYFFKTNKPKRGAIAIGISTIFKFFALLFLPFLALWYSKKARETLRKYFIFVLLIIIGVMLPIIQILFINEFSPYYYESANAALPSFEFYNGFFGKNILLDDFSNPLIAGLSLVGIDFPLSLNVFGPDALYLLPIALTVLFLIVERVKMSFQGLAKILVTFLLIYYAFSYFHIQWFLWIQPLLVYLIATDTQNRKLLKLYLLTIPLFFIYSWQWGTSLTTALFVPIKLEAWLWPSPTSLLNSIGIPSMQFVNVFRSIFTGLLLFMVCAIFDLDKLFLSYFRKTSGAKTEKQTFLKDTVHSSRVVN